MRISPDKTLKNNRIAKVSNQSVASRNKARNKSVLSVNPAFGPVFLCE